MADDTNTAAAGGDLIAAIKDDHAQVKSLLESVESATGSAKADAFEQLVTTASAHEATEQKLVHPLTKDAPGGAAVVEARLEEEAEGKQGLTELAQLGVDAPDFDAKFAELKAAILEHAEHEEHEEHPLLRQTVDESRLRELGAEYRSSEARARSEASA